MSIEELVELSRFYGANPDYVLAGGGNTSFKDGAVLAVKGSGVSLGNIGAEGFVRMDRRALGAIWGKSYPPGADEREKAVLADMMAARLPGEEGKRPSVETLLHDLLPFRFVVHTHPALVNGLTCSRGGREAMAGLFGDGALWIPITNPGYILALEVKKALEDYAARKGGAPGIIFLQNHGVFAGADTAEGIRALYRRIMESLGAKILRQPDLAAVPAPPEAGEIRQTLERLGKAAAGGEGWASAFLPVRETLALVRDRAAFWPVSSAYSPDHIVYAGSEPLFVEADLEKAWEEFRRRAGRIPRIVAMEKLGVFGLGPSEKALNYSLELFTDALRVAAYAESFGGPLFMTEEHINFINNWEVERYRSGVAGASGGKKN
jgi:rhamnose utilization protein RhaD (predicted bifunctional aldolase and dehydrogenase)